MLIAGLVALFYSNSFGNFFVWNDWTLIIENFLIKDWRNLPEIFASAFWKPLLGEPPQIYRPLVLVSFMADFFLWGLKPWGYHLTNICLHVLNSFLAYFLMRFYVSPAIALMGSLLFAVHPVQTETVAYISGRGELMMSFLILSGTVLFLGSGRLNSKGLYLASLPLFFFALLAKETAVIFPLWLLAAYHPVASSDRKTAGLNLLLRQIGPLAVLAAYFLLKRAFVGMTVSDYSLDLYRLLLLMLQAIPLYLGLLVFPLNLHFLHPVVPHASLLDVHLLLGVSLLIGAGIGLCYAMSFRNQAVVLSLGWYLVGLLSLWHYASFDLPFLESWIYLPSFGFFLLLALGLGRLCERVGSRVPAWIVLLIAVLLGGMTLNRNNDWRDNMQISLHTVAAYPDNPIALRLLGDAYFQRGRTEKAEEILQKAVLSGSKDPRLHESVGRLYRFLGRDSDALIAYQRMRELTPQDPYVYWRLGRYYLRKKNYAQAEKHLAQAVKLFPYSSELHNDLAQVYYLQGNLDAARRELEAALKILPRSKTLQKNLEQVLNKN